jgi:hypothetical protein
MSKRTMGWVLLVVLSEVLGLVVGHVFYVVCTWAVPPASVPGTARMMFYIAGLVVGVAIVGWTAFVVWLTRLFPDAADRPQQPASR